MFTVLTEAVKADPVIVIPKPVKATNDAVVALEALIALKANEELSV